MFVSLATEKFRRLFLTSIMLSCLLPVLIMVFIIYHYTVPVLEPYQKVFQTKTGRSSAHAFTDKTGLSLGNISIFCGIANYRNNMQALFSDASKALATAQETGEQIAVAPTL